HFQQEVNTASQVKTELHRTGADIQQPVRGGGGEILRDDELITQSATNNILSRQLVCVAHQPYQSGAGITAELSALGGDAGVIQRLLHALQVALLDGLSGAAAGDLNGRIIRVQVG